VGEWIRVASLQECPEEGCLHTLTHEGEPILLARWGGELFALEDRCSHQDFPLSKGEIEDGTVECVLHGARFDLRTGRAVRLPAVKGVRSYPLELRGDDIYIRID